MSNTDDTKLIERCRSGDRQAFEALLVKYEKPVFNAAYRMLNSRDDASDITQTVFLKVFESFDQFDPTRRFFSWIYRITLNESINWLSKMNRLEPLAFEAALMTMKTYYRSVVILKHFLGCSYMEISQILDVPEKKVKSRLYTARQQLKDALTGKHQWQ